MEKTNLTAQTSLFVAPTISASKNLISKTAGTACIPS